MSYIVQITLKSGEVCYVKDEYATTLHRSQAKTLSVPSAKKMGRVWEEFCQRSSTAMQGAEVKLVMC